MENINSSSQGSENEKSRNTIDLNKFRKSIDAIKLALNKGCKNGIYDLDEAKNITLNLDYLNEIYCVIENIGNK